MIVNQTVLRYGGRDISTWKRHSPLECWSLRALTEMAVQGEVHEWGSAARGRKHIERVSRGAGLMAAGLGMDARYCKTIAFAAGLHDIGKLFCPPSGVSSWYCATSELMVKAAGHTLKGGGCLSACNPMGMRLFSMAAEISLNHHEAWNGSGFPNGRSGVGIPLSARIVAIVDFYDTCVHLGGEVEALNRFEVMDLIRTAAGRYFDPALVRLFVSQNVGSSL